MLDNIIQNLSRRCKNVKVIGGQPKSNGYTRTLNIDNDIIINIGELSKLESMVGNILGINCNDKFKLHPQLSDR